MCFNNSILQRSRGGTTGRPVQLRQLALHYLAWNVMSLKGHNNYY